MSVPGLMKSPSAQQMKLLSMNREKYSHAHSNTALVSTPSMLTQLAVVTISYVLMELLVSMDVLKEQFSMILLVLEMRASVSHLRMTPQTASTTMTIQVLKPRSLVTISIVETTTRGKMEIDQLADQELDLAQAHSAVTPSELMTLKKRPLLLVKFPEILLVLLLPFYRQSLTPQE